ncbi:MAG: NAD(P)-dependent oxidoreductase [Planctomycetes bacterium]|nr:NAD(P)-dependent oxidoreductase [Planctomycetota bacterium]
MKHALVVGATGFFGRHLAAALDAAGVDVTACGRTAGEGPWRQFVALDVRDAASVRDLLGGTKADVVFWLAGRLRGSDADLAAVNVAPVANACAAIARRRERPRLVLAGSSAEYGPGTPDAAPFHEDSPCAPTMPYGRSKLAATRTALDAAAKDGIDVRVVRPSNLLGPGLSEELAIGSFVAQLAACKRADRPFVVRAGELTAQRDFLDVEDACRGLVALASYDGPMRVFNLAADACFPMRTIVDILQHEVAAPVEVLRDAERVRESTTDRVAITAAAAGRELGFRRHVSLRESIARMWLGATAGGQPAEPASLQAGFAS